MAEVIKTLGFEYCTLNPGSSFRGLHESLINLGPTPNQNPELLTCCHEESAVAMAHGYFKIEGKPMLVMAHGTVGLQHASMAIYNAYADRVPVYILLGNVQDEIWRRSDVEWAHAAQDCAAMVRDYTKWDDAPASLQHFAESAVRAYKIAMTPPMEPVVIVADAVLQEEPVPGPIAAKLRIPKLNLSTPPSGDSAAVAAAAKMLVAAESPLIVAGRAARTPAGLKSMIELAELLQAPVQDRRFRMNFPTRHPLYGSGNLADADVILGLDVPDLWYATHSMTPVNKMGMDSARHHEIGRQADQYQLGRALRQKQLPGYPALYRSGYLHRRRRRNNLARAHRSLQEIDHHGSQDCLRSPRQEVRRRLRSQSPARPGSRRLRLRRQLPALHRPRLRRVMERSSKVRGLVAGLRRDSSSAIGRCACQDFTKHYQYIGGHGAYGVGCIKLPASVGVALANRKYGRASASTSSAMAISTTLPAFCGPPRTTRFRCSPSCTTIAPIIRS